MQPNAGSSRPNLWQILIDDMARVSQRCCWHFERSNHKRALPFAASVEPTAINSFHQHVVVTRGAPVLHKCANPVCAAKLVYLRQGKLFEVEIQVTGSASKREYYWLCGQCAIDYTVCFDCKLSMLAVSSLGQYGRRKVTAISQSSSKAIVGLKRVLIRSFGTLPAMRKAVARAPFSAMEES